MNPSLDKLIQSLSEATVQPVYLVCGEPVLAEPAAQRLAEALAALAECSVEVHRRPAHLGGILEDLRTYSLFAPAKVVLAVGSALLADQAAAAQLIDELAETLPLADPAAGLTLRERHAASRLLQVLYLFELDPYVGQSEAVTAGLPDWALVGGRSYRQRRGQRGRGKKQVEELRFQLAQLLEAARQEGLHGWAESELADLESVIRNGLPRGHALVLVESQVAPEHPLFRRLREAGAVLALGQVERSRSGDWQGLNGLAEELTEQTGVAIAPDALRELARRTLRLEGDRGRAQEGADSTSTARLAAEYRKLANLAGAREIDLRLVEESVYDRGQEDVWGILDAVGAGSGEEALRRLRRYLQASNDPVAGRLSFFALFAGFCRQLTAVADMMALLGVPAGEKSYPRFKSRWSERLQSELPGGGESVLRGLHPYRLHRAYLAAGKRSPARLARLPWQLLETELRLKGDSGDPDAALAELVSQVANLGER